MRFLLGFGLCSFGCKYLKLLSLAAQTQQIDGRAVHSQHQRVQRKALDARIEPRILIQQTVDANVVIFFVVQRYLHAQRVTKKSL